MALRHNAPVTSGAMLESQRAPRDARVGEDERMMVDLSFSWTAATSKKHYVLDLSPFES